MCTLVCVCFVCCSKLCAAAHCLQLNQPTCSHYTVFLLLHTQVRHIQADPLQRAQLAAAVDMSVFRFDSCVFVCVFVCVPRVYGFGRAQMAAVV